MIKKMIISLIMVMFVISLDIYKGSTDNSKLIGAYIDNEYVSTIPNKDDGYVVEKIVCDNDTVGEWDYNDWGLLLTNVKKKARCNVYFKSDPLGNSIKLENNKEGKCPSADLDGKVKLTSYEINDAMICSIPDDYGTSYYYRGPVKNNYVYFANIYWRIIRINGDGSIRMIYDGTKAHENNEVAEDKIVGYSAFNEKTNDNTYVGYMYGTPSSSTYEETHANINDSTIKKYIDNWYDENLLDNKDFLSDNVFCNDRTIDDFTNDDYVNTKLGYGNNSTYYRWAWAPFTDIGINNHYTYLKCSNKNDRFTVSDTRYGNGALNYPIALISKDEAILAGGWGLLGGQNILDNLYFYTGIAYWTMSPHYYGDAFSSTGEVSHVGNLSGNLDLNTSDSSASILGVKPVINLKAGSLKSGDGTINNPYMVTSE